jgi:hypothetical protein
MDRRRKVELFEEIRREHTHGAGSIRADPIRRRRFAWHSSAEFQQRINQLKLKCS